MGPDVTLASCSALPLTDASSGSSRPSERRAVRARSIRRGRPHSCSHSKETPVLSAHSGSDLNEIRDLLIPPLPIRRRSDLSSCAPGIRCSRTIRDGYGANGMERRRVRRFRVGQWMMSRSRLRSSTNGRSRRFVALTKRRCVTGNFRWAMHASKSSKQASALGRRSA